MARIKLELPQTYAFSALIPLRITDLNYGGHVGNDTILSLLHEARVKYLHHYGFTEMNLDGPSLIMGDVAIEFKTELFYGDKLMSYVTAFDLNRVGFDIAYKLVKNADEQVVALAKTGMVCFNYESRKVVSLPAAVIAKLKV